MLEVIQGEGGVLPLSQDFVSEARALTQAAGALLIVDEVQSGLGRTGKWLAYQHYGIQPDITTLSKPLAGGIPLGAVLCTEAVANSMHPGMHGTTFGGGPLACAVAVAVINAIEKDHLLAHATEVGDYFQEQLRNLAKKHKAIVDVRGKGLMVAAELNSAELAKNAVAEMLKRHILINCTSDTVLRFLPPFIIQRKHIDTVIQALDEIFTQSAASCTATCAAEGKVNG
jgi:acetylornithine aminotransferase/acetylornithine/N-succinyldiaminopimelate aminotransferase